MAPELCGAAYRSCVTAETVEEGTVLNRILLLFQGAFTVEGEDFKSQSPGEVNHPLL